MFFCYLDINIKTSKTKFCFFLFGILDNTTTLLITIIENENCHKQQTRILFSHACNVYLCFCVCNVYIWMFEVMDTHVRQFIIKF